MGKTYFRHWRNALKTIRSWSDVQIEDWADHFKQELDDENDFLFHYHPGKYLVPLFLPSHIEELASKRNTLVEVRRAVADKLMTTYIPNSGTVSGGTMQGCGSKTSYQNSRKNIFRRFFV